MNKPIVAEHYKKVFDAVDYALSINLIADAAEWFLASGEISIHPYRDRFLDILKNRRVTFATNCFIYDDAIGQILEANPLAKINFSIDAGTPETWHKVKGFDNFNKVIDNLREYNKRCSRAGQIVLKYILFPGINDNSEDTTALIELMKSLGVDCLRLSRDVRVTYSMSDREKEDLIKAAGNFVAILKKAGYKSVLTSYSRQEAFDIMSYSARLP